MTNGTQKLDNAHSGQIPIGACYKQPFSFFNSDNMEIMKQFEDKHFDLACIDPEYGIGMDGGNVGYKGNNNFEKKEWDKQRPTAEFFKEIMRISKNQIIWGGNYFADLLPPTRGWIVWDKGEGFYNRTYAECELAWTSFNKNVEKFKFDPLAKGTYKGKIHPTQKPIELYEFCLKYADIKDNSSIIDSNLGSGSIALAIDKVNKMENKNLSFVGIELDTDYFQAALKRFNREIKQGCLFF